MTFYHQNLCSNSVESKVHIDVLSRFLPFIIWCPPAASSQCFSCEVICEGDAVAHHQAESWYVPYYELLFWEITLSSLMLHSRKSRVDIYNHQVDSPLHVWLSVWSGDLWIERVWWYICGMTLLRLVILNSLKCYIFDNSLRNGVGGSQTVTVA